MCRGPFPGEVRFDSSFPLGLATSLAKAGLQLVPQRGLFWPEREHKTAAELKLMRQALAITEAGAAGFPATVVSSGEQASDLWNAVATAGRRALGYQIVGAVGQMIDLAVEHACSRVQFGRPIGSFQGVRNRLAEAYVAWTAAAAALELAWEADDEYLAGMLAKSLAGRAARIGATHCQQVLAGIGFTAEHPFHRYLARALVLDSVLGSAPELRRAIGQQLVSTGTIPRLVEL